MVPFLSVLCAVLAAALGLLWWRGNRIRSSFQREAAERERSHEDALIARELERYAILNDLSDAFFLIDSEGGIRFANAPAGALFPGRELLGRSVEDIFLHKSLAKPVYKSLATNERVKRTVILPRLSSPPGSGSRRGETAWVVDAAPINSEQAPHLTRVLLRDITTEHQSEQVRKDFVANASHELRTPLAIINGYLENLLDDDVVDSPKTARRFLTVMQKHGQRIARIVEDMLMISRLESGEAGNLKMKPFPVDSCVRDVIERLEPMISSQAATISLAGSDPELKIRGDRFYWTQVLFNLVENSLKQNPDIPLRVEIGWKVEPDGQTRLWVADNGVGIPSGDLPFIFRRFYRVEKHHSQAEIKGTGLGLSIVKRAIEAHGGTVGVQSTPGQETRFDILLPAGIPDEDEREAASPVPKAVETP